ncbi:hypothetical protein F5883DRAFT_646177 [Diaporthe sp. PMI_573]|nr:hypothetical protein F5883DRAFT_646177 [Diaporthaceae sp. PMI_573]
MALGIYGLGCYIKRGFGFIVDSILSGAVILLLTGAVADIYDMLIAMVVPMAFFIAAWTYELAVNFVPKYCNTADAFTETEVGLYGHYEGVAEDGSLGADEEKAVVTEQKEAS